MGDPPQGWFPGAGRGGRVPPDDDYERGLSEMYIETPRMVIRDFTPDDAADLHEILGDDETMEHWSAGGGLDQNDGQKRRIV